MTPTGTVALALALEILLLLFVGWYAYGMGYMRGYGVALQKGEERGFLRGRLAQSRRSHEMLDRAGAPKLA